MLVKDGTGDILMVKASYKDYWTPPGGIVEKDASPKETVEKEMFEELGIRVKAKKLTLVMYRFAERDMPEKMFWFFDGGVLGEEEIKNIKPDGDEILEFKFMTKKEILNSTADWGERWEKIIEVWESGQTQYFDNDEIL